MKKILAIFLILNLCSLVGMPVSAQATVSATAETYTFYKNSEYKKEALSNPNLTFEQINAINEKYDYILFASSQDFKSMSTEEKQAYLGKNNEPIIYSRDHYERAKIAEKSMVGSSNIRSTNANEYICYVDCIMQETSVWCSAATIQQTLETMNGYSVIDIDVASQSNIMNVIGNGPGLQTLLNYINNQQSAVQYVKANYSDESDLLIWLSYSAYHKSPTILHMNATSANVSTGYWPYYTPGHYTNLDGKNDSGRWIVSDPYYYNQYVSSPEFQGWHYRTYTHIATVNGNKYGSNNKTIGF